MNIVKLAPWKATDLKQTINWKDIGKKSETLSWIA